jgi:hypothetical protein
MQGFLAATECAQAHHHQPAARHFAVVARECQNHVASDRQEGCGSCPTALQHSSDSLPVPHRRLQQDRWPPGCTQPDCAHAQHLRRPCSSQDPIIPQLRHSYIRHEALSAALAAEPVPSAAAPTRPALRHLVAVASRESERNVLLPGTAAPDPHRCGCSSRLFSAAHHAVAHLFASDRILARELVPDLQKYGHSPL